MTPTSFGYGNGRRRAWTVNDNLCGIVKRDVHGDYVGSVDYNDVVARILVREDSLDKVIKAVERHAEEGPDPIRNIK